MEMKLESDAPTFEAALARLEVIVSRLERGEITLDESLLAFQEGSDLVRFCLNRLTAAEAQVQRLVSGENGPAVTPLPLDPEEGKDA
jgi:exodeoxyribonuclease VII small subunit